MRDPLFIGCFPAGFVYADRTRERDGDYVRLAFLPYDTLVLELQPDCPPALADRIRQDAAIMQAKAGEHYRVSTTGATVLLGSRRPPALAE